MRIVAVLALVVAVTLVQGSHAVWNIDAAMIAAVKATFARADTNKDGLWTQDEHARALAIVDADGNGLVTWDELRHAILTNPRSAFSTYAPSSILVEHEKAVFACIVGSRGYIPVNVPMTYFQPWYDTNRDGALSLGEAINFHVKVILENVKGTNKCPQGCP